MSLLGDARNLRDRSSDFPPCCDKDDRANPRATMDRIVAVLEAAEAVVHMQFAAWCAHANAINDLAEAMQDRKD